MVGRRGRRCSATPHSFLPYVGSDSELAIRSTESKHTSRRNFEDKCTEYLQEDARLSSLQAKNVVSSLRKAADEVASGKENLNLQYLLFASIVRQSLRRREGGKIEVQDDKSLELVDLVNDEKNPMPSEIESLRRQLKRSREEVNFLRCAVRQLVIPLRDKDIKSGQKQDKTGDETRLQNVSVPSKIEFMQRRGSEDEISVDLSQLTPSVEFRLPKNCLPIVVNSYPEPLEMNLASPYALANKKMPQIPKILPNFDVDKPMVPPSISERYLETMQLVYSFRSERTQSGQSDMVKGEIRNNRARGMRFQLRFENFGVRVSGTYNGTLKNGVPHGSGVLRFDNRDFYIGEFHNGALHGEGTLFSRKDFKLVKMRGKFSQNEFVGKCLPLSDETTSAGAA